MTNNQKINGCAFLCVALFSLLLVASCSSKGASITAFAVADSENSTSNETINASTSDVIINNSDNQTTPNNESGNSENNS